MCLRDTAYKKKNGNNVVLLKIFLSDTYKSTNLWVMEIQTVKLVIFYQSLSITCFNTFFGHYLTLIILMSASRKDFP